VGAAFSFILGETGLGLSAPPPERVPENLSDEEMIRQAIEEERSEPE
jgi:hypothetical protein